MEWYEWILWTLSFLLNMYAILFSWCAIGIALARQNIDQYRDEDELTDCFMSEMWKLKKYGNSWIFKPVDWLTRTLVGNSKWTDDLRDPVDSAIARDKHVGKNSSKGQRKS